MSKKKLKRLVEKQQARDELVDGLVDGFQRFMQLTDEQAAYAKTYLDGDEGENDLIRRLLVKYARKNSRARTLLSTLSSKKRKSVSSQRAAHILKQASE